MRKPLNGKGFDGGEPRVRGNVYQQLERYLQLARDAGAAGDRVAAENYLQHAEHYYRVISESGMNNRPRINGRDVSVADVTVQNVSPGLAAVYAGENSAEDENDMADGEDEEAAEPVESEAAPAAPEQKTHFRPRGRPRRSREVAE
jgi:hypothetical protein